MTKTQATTIKQLAQEVLNNMEVKTRDDKSTFVSLKEHKPQWHVDLMHKAHGHILPNDYVYQAIQDALEAITQVEGSTEQDISDNVLSGGYIEAEVYNAELLKWVSDNLTFAEYVDQALDDYGPKSFFEALRMGNQLFKEEIFHSILNGLVEQIKGEARD